MRYKPMLFHKLNNKNQERTREVIGLVGTHHGVGVTHTGLMLAFYMGEELGRKTALLECNHQHDMMLIQNAYEWEREEENTFTYHLITCFKDVKPGQITSIFAKEYDCIIMDFGDDYSMNRDEFLRCTIKIVVGGRSEWDLYKLLYFIRTTEADQANNWWFLIPQATDKRVMKISKDLNRRVWAIPIVEEPILPSPTAYYLFRRLLRS